MTTFRQEPSLERSRDLCWWSLDRSGSGAVEQLEVLAEPVLETDWCTMHRVSPGAIPHQIRFRHHRHTLMIFDKGSFVEGERRIDGIRLGTSGPLDLGVDVAPAYAEFEALAWPGSEIRCTLIFVDGDKVARDAGARSDFKLSLHPAINLGGELLQPLANRLRQLIWADERSTDSLYLETVCMLLFREVSLAQEKGHMSGASLHAGGLSGRAQRVIRDFLHENLNQKINLDAFASQVGISRSHFIRAFKISFGVPPHRYLLDLRIRRAINLLHDTQRPITDIAPSVGFSSSSEFARAFRRVTGHTPREFRLLNQ